MFLTTEQSIIDSVKQKNVRRFYMEVVICQVNYKSTDYAANPFISHDLLYVLLHIFCRLKISKLFALLEILQVENFFWTNIIK